MAKLPHRRDVDSILRHVFPILCYLALASLYNEVDQLYRTKGFWSSPVFGGLCLVQDHSWLTLVFVPQGIWFLYSSVHLIFLFLVWLVRIIQMIYNNAVNKLQPRP